MIRIAYYLKRHHIALLAVFLGLGGGTAFAAGNALLPRNSVGTKQVINGSLAAVDAGGTVTRSSGATSAQRTSAGVYRMTFTTDITNCVYLATAGQDAGSLFLDYHLYTKPHGHEHGQRRDLRREERPN